MKILRLRNVDGFTMIEMMVVIAIIGVLASILTMNVVGSQKRSQNAKMIAQAKQIQNGFELYYSENENYCSEDGVDDCSADCSTLRGNTDFFPQGAPADAVYYCDADSYCVCVSLNDHGGVYQGANSDGTRLDDNECDFVNGTKTHFCVTNSQ